MDVPEKRAVHVLLSRRAAPGQVQQSADHREGVPAHEYAIVVETEAASDNVKELAYVFGGRVQCLLEVRDRDVV